MRIQPFCLVMQQPTAPGFTAPGTSRDHYQWRFLGIDPGHGIDHIECTCAVDDRRHAGGEPEVLAAAPVANPPPGSWLRVYSGKIDDFTIT